MSNPNFFRFQIPSYGDKFFTHSTLRKVLLISYLISDLIYEAIEIWDLKNWNLITYSFKRHFRFKGFRFLDSNQSEI